MPSTQERLTALETRFDEVVIPSLNELGRKVDRVDLRLDKIDLNGHGPDIKRLAEATPKLVALAERADVILAAADRSAESLTFRRLLSQKVHWTAWKKAAGVVASAVAGVVAWQVLGPYIHNLFFH